MRILSRWTLAIAAIAAVLALPGDFAWAQPPSESALVTTTRAYSMVAVDKLTRKIAEANPEYPDPYKVPIGAIIRVPVDDPTGHKVVVEYKTEPWHLGQNGCFWQIAEGHLAGTLAPIGRLDIPPAYTPEPLVSVPVPAAQDESFDLANLFGILVGISLLGLAAMGYLKARERRNERRRDPDSYPPVIAGGLSEDPELARRQIEATTQVRHGRNRAIQSYECGVVRSRMGKKSFPVKSMDFGDDISRPVDIKDGDATSRLQVLENGQVHTEYWRYHCGNRMNEVASGEFQLPEGWEFIPTPNQSAQIPVPVPAADTEAAQELASIERTTGRIEAHARAQAAVNPDGTYRVTFTVKNGQPVPTEVTATSDGHRPFKTIKYRGGAIEATF